MQDSWEGNQLTSKKKKWRRVVRESQHRERLQSLILALNRYRCDKLLKQSKLYSKAGENIKKKSTCPECGTEGMTRSWEKRECTCSTCENWAGCGRDPSYFPTFTCRKCGHEKGRSTGPRYWPVYQFRYNFDTMVWEKISFFDEDELKRQFPSTWEDVSRGDLPECHHWRPWYQQNESDICVYLMT